ncbi:hypothetical protein J7F03_05790 [Streptomyces sp. ISL-43]|uniref:condensation domain-containing protein n=1 Tax=Streptomyces sp. ISL-43 TaxID=2819183 RepID=UPI001BE59943|nr:condensation domain-containing protein [Streptomyces sp. ISL-43]MBT2446601.1 hypothetical protein [Streptomyces sp. ISL-43]
MTDTPIPVPVPAPLPVRSRVSLEFTAGPDREGPMAWGQAKLHRELQDHPDDRYLAFLPLLLPVPPGRTVDTVLHALRTIMSCYESLRTVYPVHGRQSVSGTVRLSVHLVDTDDREAAATATRNLREELRSAVFDTARELPLRAGIVTEAGHPSHLVLVLSHMAVDGLALQIVEDHLTALLTGGAFTLRGLDRAAQPLDLARDQASPVGLSRGARALAQWEDAYRRTPPAMFATAHAEATAAPVYWEGFMTSRRIAEATRTISERTGAGRSTVVLAAVEAVFAARTGVGRTGITSISANRASPSTAAAVTTLAQDALIVVDTAEAHSFDHLIGLNRQDAQRAYRYSPVDPAAQREVRERIDAERGTPFTRDLVYNDMSAYPTATGPVPPGLGTGERADIRVEAATFMPVHAYVTVYRMDETAEITLWADGRTLEPRDIVSWLRAVEAVLVSAADQDLPAHVLDGLCSGGRPV